MIALLQRFGLVLAALVLLAADASAAPAPAGASIPPGTARVWFYRTFFPGDTQDMPAVAMNGRTVGYARPGYSFYRDVPAGSYHVTVDSFGRDVDQAKDFSLAAGAELYIAIQSDPQQVSNLGAYRRGTYYVWIEPLSVATQHVAQTSLSSGY